MSNAGIGHYSDPIIATTKDKAILWSDSIVGHRQGYDDAAQFTVALPEDGSESLCYGMYGSPNDFYNIISDTCTSVNVHFTQHPVRNNENRISSIGIISVTGDEDTPYAYIQIDLLGCRAIINNKEIITSKVIGHMRVKNISNGWRVFVPNCEHSHAVMWITCEEDMLLFYVSRSSNLSSTSHGLLGQFWNVPITVARSGGVLNIIYVKGNNPYSFHTVSGRQTYDGTHRVVYYYVPSDESFVFEGNFTDYKTNSLFATYYKYSKFDDKKFHIVFEKSEYSVLEDVGSLEACAVITGGNFSETLFLKLYTIQDTATAPRDYGHQELNVEIKSASVRKQCINISIVNNRVPDMSRQFELRISSNSHNLSTTASFVHILDDEIERGCTFEVLNSSISEEEEGIKVVQDIFTSVNISTLLGPVVSIDNYVLSRTNKTDPQPPMKIIYTALSEEFEIKATKEGYNNFVEAVNQVIEAKKAACEEGSINATDVPRLARQYSTFKNNVIENIFQLRDVFGKMLCIKEKEFDEKKRRKRNNHCPDRSECECPKRADGTILWDEIVCVCEFFACMDPDQDLKPILGMHNIKDGLACLALVVDTTGSMTDEIEAAKEVIHNFLRSEEDNPACYALLPFNDLSDDIFIEASIGAPTAASTYNGIISVTELNNFRIVTNGLEADGGFDCPERQLQALLSALGLTDTEGYQIMLPGSHIVLLTDAPSHDLDLEGKVIGLANDQKVCISFFISMRGGCIDESGRRMYHRIANETGGTVTESISQDGFRHFDATHEDAQCLDFYNLRQRRKRQALPTPGSVCQTFFSFQFTTKLKLIANTSQSFITVIKPNGESTRVSALYGSSGPVYSDVLPLAGEYRVCVSNGTLNITVERNDMMDRIKFLRPVENTTQFLITSSPPPACTAGKISVKTSRVTDITSAEIQLLRDGTDDILVAAPLYGCNNLLKGDITFPSGTVKYRMVGNDASGLPFSISLTHSTTFEPGYFYLERGGNESVDITPYQTELSRITACNLNEGPAQYSFSYVRVTGLRQTFHPSNQLLVPPGACGSVNLAISVISAEPGSTHASIASVTDGCSTQNVSLRINILSQTTAPTTPPPRADECGCQNGGTCNITIIRGREIGRCMCPVAWRGPQCTIEV